MDYNRSLIKHIETLTLENESLKRENSYIRKENRSLHERINALERSMSAKIEAAIEETAAPLRQKISDLETASANKDTEIQRLKAVINKDSSNSSKPPSSDGFKKIPNNREKSSMKQGGQAGHKGYSLKIPANLDELVKTGKVERKLIDQTGGAKKYISKWIVDVDIRTIYTEIRYPVGTLLPSELQPEVIYGSGIKTLAVLLEQEGVMAIKRMTDLFSTLTNGAVKPSKGAIESFIAAFADSTDDDIASIKAELLNGLLINTDDTPMRCSQTLEYNENGEVILKTAVKTTFNVNVRTYSNEKVTLYTVNPKKDDAGILRDGILPFFYGILSHDHDKKFYKYSKRHATCCEHLTRDLKGLRDLYLCSWADSFRSFMYEMNSLKKKDLAEGRKGCDNDTLHSFSEHYDELVSQGALILKGMAPEAFGYDELRKMLSRLTSYKDAYMLFIRDYDAPFTNNLAERDLRPCKTRQKISGCFRTWKGISDFAKTRSVISSWKKQGCDLYSNIYYKFSLPLLSFGLPSGQ